METFKLRLVAVGIEGAINLGFIARLVDNFDVDEFYVVSPKTTIEESLRYAARASETLKKAKIVESLEEALRGVDISFCSSAVTSRGDDVLRSPITPWEMAEIALRRGGTVAVVVGRESTGLTRSEIKQCNLLVNIPSSPRYRALNVSNATAILLYELYKVRGRATSRTYVDRETMDLINRYIDALVDTVVKDEEKKEEEKLALKRIVVKSVPSKEEGKALLYILSKICRKIEGCMNAFKVTFNR
jgi:tRNA (cytidine32/uridine32-2'-O)-methyltransferase